jgi:hypothetical protein
MMDLRITHVGGHIAKSPSLNAYIALAWNGAYVSRDHPTLPYPHLSNPRAFRHMARLRILTYLMAIWMPW